MTGTPYTSRKVVGVESTMFKEYKRSSAISFLAKRIFDICASFIGLILLAPFFLVIAYFIHRDSPGPVFFRCIRMGKNEKPFNILKFRTMFERPSSYAGPRITCAEDDRITPFGHWLRDTKINELPQLWNVLKGEMSLVGPRPEDVSIANEWSEEDRKLICSVAPGITSPASILYRDEEQLLSKGNLMQDYLKNILPDKMRFDRLYVQNRSFTSDLDVLFWTLVIIIPNMIKTQVPEGYLFAGPISRLLNRFLSWLLIDFCVSFVAVGGVAFFWRMQSPINFGAGNFTLLALIMAVLFTIINHLLGLNKIIWQSADLLDALKLSLSSWLVTLLIMVLNYLQSTMRFIPSPPLPMLLIFVFGIVAQIGFIMMRYRWRILTTIASAWLSLRRNRMGIGERVLIVGGGDAFQTAHLLLRQKEFRYIFRIIGLVDDNNLVNQGMVLNGCMILGKVTDLPKIIEREKISVIVFTTLNVPKKIKDYVNDLKEKPYVRLIFLDNLSRLISQQLTTPLHTPVYSLWSGNYHEFMAIHDSFSGLPNRTLFQDRLMHSVALSKRYKTKPVVAFVEIDVRNQQESIEEKAWNVILKQVIDRMKKFKRESDTLAFLWGGVFAFLLENIPDENALSIFVERLSASLSEPIQTKSQMIHLKSIISVGQEIEESIKSKQIGEHEDVLDTVFANRKVKKVLQS